MYQIVNRLSKVTKSLIKKKNDGAKISAGFLLILTVIEILFFIFSYGEINQFARTHNLVHSLDIQWGIGVQLYELEYVIIIIIKNILLYFFRKRLITLCLCSSLVFYFCLYSDLALKYYPYRGSLVIFLGVVGFFLYPVWLMVKKLWKSLKTRFLLI